MLQLLPHRKSPLLPRKTVGSAVKWLRRNLFIAFLFVEHKVLPATCAAKFKSKCFSGFGRIKEFIRLFLSDILEERQPFCIYGDGKFCETYSYLLEGA